MQRDFCFHQIETDNVMFNRKLIRVNHNHFVTAFFMFATNNFRSICDDLPAEAGAADIVGVGVEAVARKLAGVVVAVSETV